MLSGKILDLGVEAKKGFLLTDIEAKSKLVIQAKNRQDDSSLTRTDAHSGSHDNVLWFEPQDGEQILSEVLEKNFERFVVNTKNLKQGQLGSVSPLVSGRHDRL